MYLHRFQSEIRMEMRVFQYSLIISMALILFAGCGGEKEKEPAVKVETSGSQIIIRDTSIIVSTPESEKPGTTSASSKTTGGNFTVQVGAFHSELKAHESIMRYRDQGYDAYLEEATVGEKKQVWYRVRIGRYDKRADAEEMATELNSKGDIKAWVDKIAR